MPSRKELANAIRALSMDAVQKANSGHPGAPMGMADIAEVLWRDYLNHNPTNPNWADRDRFVLSNGHGSMLIYSLLHLTGYDLPISELANFRQLHSKTPATQNMATRRRRNHHWPAGSGYRQCGRFCDCRAHAGSAV
ncbi:Transketolase 1 [Ewingella americana]|uniref:Transketolase 1 n=1 Tax=Ewingella americana TaxID=41202 RepID=A0A377N9G9_9GAMM|nr:Transketolase 1 [Ewingella americana]